MPCVVDTSYEDAREWQRLNRIACAMAKMLDAKRLPFPTDEARDWWSQHKKQDAERRRREAEDAAMRRAAKRAMDKLTPAERRAIRETR